MKMKSILKIALIVGVLLVALAATSYAASITAVSGTDGTNAFATTAEGVTKATPEDATLTINGTVDTAKANVTLMISAENTVVYVNQVVAGTDGAFKFEFPVTLEKGYTYNVKVNTANSAKASELYFKSEDDEPVHYGDISGDSKLLIADVNLLSRAIGGLKVSATAQANFDAGLGDVSGDGVTKVADVNLLARYIGKLKVAATATERLGWYTMP